MISFDQAHHLRQLAKDSAPRARVLTLVSGKGGVGKSNLAANLSLSLARANRRVLLVDADLALANLDILFGLPAGPNLADLLKGPHNLAEIATVVAPGLRLLPGASGLTSLAELSDYHQARLIDLLETLESSSDFLIIDASAGISGNVLGFAAAADDVLVVTTPEPPAIADAYAVIKVLLRERQLSNMMLVINMAKNVSQVRQVHSRIAGAAKRFLNLELPLAGFVLYDRHVHQAVSSRRPFVWSFPRCHASRQVHRLAKDVLAANAAPSLARSSRKALVRTADWLL